MPKDKDITEESIRDGFIGKGVTRVTMRKEPKFDRDKHRKEEKALMEELIRLRRIKPNNEAEAHQIMQAKMRVIKRMKPFKD